MTALISTEDLANTLGSPDLRILDASWHMPAEKRNAQMEYEARHIPGAAFFDIDSNCDKSSPYPHMLPAAKDFSASVSALGISNHDEIVIYDSSGLFSAPRVWWMFRVFGHDKVRVLDGGLLKWNAEGRALESGTFLTPPAVFQSTFRPELLRNRRQVESTITRKNEQIIDARSTGRFLGKEPEPRAGLASGHIEGSLNMFFKDCLSPPYNRLKSTGELSALFKSLPIDPKLPVITTCGSGVTACILALALYELGNKTVAVYDGAWAEWGSNPPQ